MNATVANATQNASNIIVRGSQLHDKLAAHHPQYHGVEVQHLEEDDIQPMNPMFAILLIYGILFMMIAAQAALFLWRNKHKKSYELVTLVGLWIMPAIFCVQLRFWRFFLVWLSYTGVTAYVLSLCLHKKMETTTPRTVYSWFLGVYRVSKVIGVAGYVMLLCEMLGLAPLFRLIFPRDMAMDLVWYGLYFGVLGRDCAEVASDRMASVMGSGGRQLMNSANKCGICGNDMQDFSHLGEEPSEEVEKCVQLSCKHCFHDHCVRGWTMVGKKDTCPVCMEKVDLRALYSDRPWETRNLTWIQMLDSVRYLVVWNPLIFMALSVVFHFVLPHPHHHHHDPVLTASGGVPGAGALHGGVGQHHGAGGPLPGMH